MPRKPVVTAKPRVTGGRIARLYFSRKVIVDRNLRGTKFGFMEGYYYPRRKGRKRISAATVAGMNEFGNPQRNTPERPFFRGAIKTIRRNLRKRAAKIIDPMKPELGVKLAGLLGTWTVRELRKSITHGTWKPLSKYTIALRKKRSGPNASTQPLVDTGHMYDSATWELLRPNDK